MQKATITVSPNPNVATIEIENSYIKGPLTISAKAYERDIILARLTNEEKAFLKNPDNGFPKDGGLKPYMEEKNGKEVINDIFFEKLVKIDKLGRHLNLSNKNDFLDYIIIKQCPNQIAPDFESCGNARFYLHDPTIESKKRVSKMEIEHKAISKLLKCSDDLLNQLIQSYGNLGTEFFNREQKLDYLRSRIDDDAELFLNRVNNPEELAVRIIYNKAKIKKLVHFKNGLYYYNNRALGPTDDASITMLALPENADVRSFLQDALNK